MPFRTLFFLQAAVLALVGAVHVVAIQYYLYWHYIWLDIPVHFLGGVWAALVALWFIAAFGLPQRVLLVMAAVLAISIGWEVFEVMAGVPMEANFALDTSIDLTMDTLGAVLGFFLGRRLVRA